MVQYKNFHEMQIKANSKYIFNKTFFFYPFKFAVAVFAKQKPQPNYF